MSLLYIKLVLLSLYLMVLNQFDLYASLILNKFYKKKFNIIHFKMLARLCNLVCNLCEIIRQTIKLMLVQALTEVKIELLKNHDFLPL